MYANHYGVIAMVPQIIPAQLPKISTHTYMFQKFWKHAVPSDKKLRVQHYDHSWTTHPFNTIGSWTSLTNIFEIID